MKTARSTRTRLITAVVVLAVTLLVTNAPAGADPVEGITADVSITCRNDVEPGLVFLSFEMWNTTPQEHTVHIERSSLPAWSTSLGAGTPSTPGYLGGYSSWNAQQAGTSVTLGIRVGAGGPYVYGPVTVPNPCLEIPADHGDGGSGQCPAEPCGHDEPHEPTTTTAPPPPPPSTTSTTVVPPEPATTVPEVPVPVEVLESQSEQDATSPATLPRTGASTAVVALGALMTLALGLVLHRADAHDRR